MNGSDNSVQRYEMRTAHSRSVDYRHFSVLGELAALRLALQPTRIHFLGGSSRDSSFARSTILDRVRHIRWRPFEPKLKAFFV